jgi:hypothetical protein
MPVDGNGWYAFPRLELRFSFGAKRYRRQFCKMKIWFAAEVRGATSTWQMEIDDVTGHTLAHANIQVPKKQ